MFTGGRMRDLARNIVCTVFVVALFVAMAEVFGFIPEGNGQWPEIDDHPTNWSDTALHS